MLLPLPSGERSPGRDVLGDGGPPAAKPICAPIPWAAPLTALPTPLCWNLPPGSASWKARTKHLEFTEICFQGMLSI